MPRATKLLTIPAGSHERTAAAFAIVNIASIAGQIGLTGTVAYAASKGGVVMLTRALAVEWATQNVRVNAIAPLWFESNIGDLIHREPNYAERAMPASRSAAWASPTSCSAPPSTWPPPPPPWSPATSSRSMRHPRLIAGSAPPESTQ